MGYTYEVDLHFWMKRAWALGRRLGRPPFHLRRIEAATIGGGCRSAAMTFASELTHAWTPISWTAIPHATGKKKGSLAGWHRRTSAAVPLTAIVERHGDRSHAATT